METPQGTYTNWFWPAPPLSEDGTAGYSSFEHRLVVELDQGPDAAYFWAHQFALRGGAGGYLGLQTKGTANGTTGRIAIFSIWDAVAARGTTPVRFSGEGEGWSCRVIYPWEVGRSYRLSVRNPARAWWSASVVDEVSGVHTEIGWIQVPHGWERLDTWSVMWTEWYGGPVARCADIPHSSVIFHTPVADDGLFRPDRSENQLGTGGTCKNSRVERLPEGSRQEVGVPSGVPPTP